MDQLTVLALLFTVIVLDGRTSAQRSCIKCTTSTFACMLGTKAPDPCTIPDDLCTVRIVEGFFGNGVTTRGCLGDIEDPVERARCEDPEDFSCITCGDGNACNNQVWRSCHMCREAVNETCAAEQVMILDATYCGNYREPNLCYERFVGGKVERGCEADLGEGACQGNSECLVCDRDACNKDDSKAFKGSLCHQCDSLSDPDCAAGAVGPTHCGQEDVCITRVVEGVLERSCLSKLNEEDQQRCRNPQDASCLMCDTESCNTVQWLQCHQCNGTSACNEEQHGTESKFCKKYVPDSRCYERIQDHMVVRGCEADLEENACETNLECRSCEADLCNSDAAYKMHTRQRCQQCSTSGDDVDGSCLLGTAPTKPCTVQSGGKCYSRVDGDGTLHRGCLGELPSQDAQACTTDTCSICDNEDCNKGLFPTNRLQCYQCKATPSDTSCEEEPKSSYCRTYISEDKCYTRIVNDILERGCQSDLGVEVDACDKLDNKHCRHCDGANCNALSRDELLSGSFACKLAFNFKLAVTLLSVVTFMVVGS